MYGLGICEQCSFYALFYPPGGICAKACTIVGVKIINRFYKAQVALLNKVTKTHSSVSIFFCDVNDQSEIAANQLLSGPGVVFFNDKFTERVLLFDGKQ